jgi:hypothetical protein
MALSGPMAGPTLAEVLTLRLLQIAGAGIRLTCLDWGLIIKHTIGIIKAEDGDHLVGRQLEELSFPPQRDRNECSALVV